LLFFGVLSVFCWLLFVFCFLLVFVFGMLFCFCIGSCSSLFIAVPILAALKERETRFRQLRARLESRPGGERRPRAVPPEEPREVTPAPTAVATAAATRATARGQGSRPGAKGRRKPPAKRKRR